MSSIQWRIRRGLLELDYIFHGFYQYRYETLSDIEKKQFIDLLEIADPDLLEWVIYRKPCPIQYREVMIMIHQHIDT
jgi:antitoxin CptB